MEKSSGAEDPIIDVVTDKTASFVWDAKSVEVLRTQHRIVGQLVGQYSDHLSQGSFASLPLILSKEEVTLARTKGWVRVLDDSDPYPLPTQEDVEYFNEERKKHLEQQQEEYYKKRKLISDQFREAKKIKIEIPDDYDKEKKNKLNFNKSQRGIVINIPTKCNLSNRKLKPAEWNFPSTDFEKLRFRVFTDLWEKGYYVTSGAKFGADYLVYPADPLRYHSHFIVHIIPWGQTFKALNIVSWSRLGHSTNKSPILATTDSKDTIQYITFHWQGIS